MSGGVLSLMHFHACVIFGKREKKRGLGLKVGGLFEENNEKQAIRAGQEL
jgi:hypothetical protein